MPLLKIKKTVISQIGLTNKKGIKDIYEDLTQNGKPYTKSYKMTIHIIKI